MSLLSFTNQPLLSSPGGSQALIDPLTVVSGQINVGREYCVGQSDVTFLRSGTVIR
jgi:hypothetical protein